MTRKGVWNLQQVRDKYLQDLWSNPNRLFLSGSNNHGVLGQNQAYDTGAGSVGRSSPIQVGGDWNGITSSQYGITATRDDGTLWAWGKNTYGQLGHNDVNRRSSPTQIPGTTWKRVGSSSYATLATKTDGTLWAWGRNHYGTLGQNDRTDKSSPVQVGSDTTWDWPVSGGGYHVGAVKTDGTLWTWGSNSEGQLGHNNAGPANRSSPVQCSSGTEVTQAQFAIETSYFINGASGFSFGKNTDGQLGHNNTTSYSSPKAISGAWISLCGGSDKTGGGIKSDGTLWAWGDGTAGSLGQNQATFPTGGSPKQITTDTTWTLISGVRTSGGSCFLATKSNGTMYKWGSAGSGSFGLNGIPANDKISSPTQIPGTQWSQEFYQQNIMDGNVHASIKSTLTPSQL